MTNDVNADAALRDRFPAQIAAEIEELRNAPLVYSGALNLRCHFCGQLTDGGSLIHGPLHPESGQVVGEPRLKGVCCGG